MGISDKVYQLVFNIWACFAVGSESETHQNSTRSWSWVNDPVWDPNQAPDQECISGLADFQIISGLEFSGLENFEN
jgi:hypothetical protein